MLPLAVFSLIGVFTQQTFADEPEAIVGGTPAAPGEFPWQCSLNFYNHHICGCSIIGATKILTAAHCVEYIQPPNNNFFVRTGTIDSIRGDVHLVKKITIHPNYTNEKSEIFKNDIAVITLASPIEYNKYQSPIPLAYFVPATGTVTTLSGWGLKRFDETSKMLTETLLKMTQSVISLSQCQQNYDNMVTLTSAHLCAYNRRGIGACLGDTGGPLIANGRLVGVSSWFESCAEGKPDIYTSVVHHRSFIFSEMFDLK